MIKLNEQTEEKEQDLIIRGAPSILSPMTNLIGGSGPTESLVVHQLGHAGLLSAHCTAGLLGPQLDGPESGVLSVKHQQLLAAGSWSAGSRKEETM